MRRLLLLVPLLLLLVGGPVSASGWAVILGDVDGFGFNGVDGPDPATNNGGAPWTSPHPAAPPMQKAAGGAADADLDGKLEIEDTGGTVLDFLVAQGVTDDGNPKEYLPDIDGDGVMNTNSGDIWDNRNASELADTAITTWVDAVDTGSTGSKWTDVSIAREYDNVRLGNPTPASTSDNLLNVFPDPAGSGLPNNATFTFGFTINKPNPCEGNVVFALLFGDYDVDPAQVQISGPNVPGGMTTISLTKQSNATGEDGLIQLAGLAVPFNWVFSDGGATWNGSLTAVVLSAPLEPYYAIDAVAVFGTQIPEPATLALFGLGALGLLAWRRRRSIA